MNTGHLEPPTAVAKYSGVNMNLNVSTNLLDQCIATLQKGDYPTIGPLILANSSNVASLTTYNTFLGDQITQNVSISATATGLGDGFNNSYYFVRSGIDLATSQWSIYSINVDPYPLPPSEIWNNNLVALGNNQIDFGTSGVHTSWVSLLHFLKYYFCHILSLENLGGDGQFWRSGLAGNASTINMNYSATFDNKGGTNNSESISPVDFCRSTMVLIIRDGRIISVVQ